MFKPGKAAAITPPGHARHEDRDEYVETRRTKATQFCLSEPTGRIGRHVIRPRRARRARLRGASRTNPGPHNSSGRNKGTVEGTASDKSN